MRPQFYMLFCLPLILMSQMSFAIGTTKMKNNIVTEIQVSEVKQAYQDWLKAVETAKGDPTKVVALYAPNAILLPTLSPVIKLNLSASAAEELFDITTADIKEYFVAFTSLKDIHATTNKIYTQLFQDVAVNTGLYTFEYIDDKGNKVEVPARFTFVYEKLDGKWKIINHHSSVAPIAH